MEKAAKSVKRVTLELGGKSPNIILPDADLKKAIPGALTGVMFNQGQVCCAGSRVFIHKDQYDKVVDEMAAYSKSLRQGAGLHEDTQMGPLVSKEQHERVLSYIEKDARRVRKSRPAEHALMNRDTLFLRLYSQMSRMR